MHSSRMWFAWVSSARSRAGQRACPGLSAVASSATTESGTVSRTWSAKKRSPRRLRRSSGPSSLRPSPARHRCGDSTPRRSTPALVCFRSTKRINRRLVFIAFSMSGRRRSRRERASVGGGGLTRGSEPRSQPSSPQPSVGGGRLLAHSSRGRFSAGEWPVGESGSFSCVCDLPAEAVAARFGQDLS